MFKFRDRKNLLVPALVLLAVLIGLAIWRAWPPACNCPPPPVPQRIVQAPAQPEPPAPVEPPATVLHCPPCKKEVKPRDSEKKSPRPAVAKERPPPAPQKKEIVVGPPPILPPVVAVKCVELTFRAPVGGRVRWGVGTTSGPFLKDPCNAQRQGGGSWTEWDGDCDICVPAVGYIQGILGSSAQIRHKHLYGAVHERQTLRFSTAVWTNVVYLCLEYPDGSQTCGVYMRPQDWRGRHHVNVPEELWQRDDGNCPG